jgi:predicted Zn-dependent peptidase
MTGLRFDHTRLGSGLTVIGERNDHAQSLAAGYFVNTGGRDEAPLVSGVSHFLEHMMFKGTARRSAEDINREFDELGANYNAYTSEERTVYYGSVLPERGAALLDLLTDMMRPALREEDFAVEKKVILEEIAMYEDRPGFRVFELGNPRFWGEHPLGQSVLGTTGSIADLTAAQMRDYFETRYAPDNMVLAVAGKYDWEAVVAQVAALTEGWRPKGAGREHPVPKCGEGRADAVDPSLNRAHVAVFAPGVSAQDERRYAAAVLANCLGDSVGSRLYWGIVDKGLADSATLQHDACDGAGAFVGYLGVAPEQLEPVLARYLDVLVGARAESLGAEEWARAQRKLATGLSLRGETPYGRLMSFGSGYLLTGEYQPLQETVKRIFAARREDAAALLDGAPFERAFAMVLRP